MSESRLRRTAAAVIGISCVAAIAATAAFGAKPSATPRQALAGTQPAWTSAVAKTGNVPSNAAQGAKVWLAPRNAAQLTALARTVSDPSSTQYRQFLTHAQYVSQYAPTSAQVSAV